MEPKDNKVEGQQFQEPGSTQNNQGNKQKTPKSTSLTGRIRKLLTKIGLIAAPGIIVGSGWDAYNAYEFGRQPYNIEGVNFNEKSVDANKEVEKIVSQNLCTVFGDTDHCARQLPTFLAKHALALAKGGMKVFFIEYLSHNDPESVAKVEEFYKTGDRRLLQDIFNSNVRDEYIEMFAACRKNGIRVYGMDVKDSVRNNEYYNSKYYVGSRNYYGYGPNDLPENLRESAKRFHETRHADTLTWSQFIQDTMQQYPPGTKFGCNAGTGHIVDSLAPPLHDRFVTFIPSNRTNMLDLDEQISRRFGDAPTAFITLEVDYDQARQGIGLVKVDRPPVYKRYLAARDEPEARFLIPSNYTYMANLRDVTKPEFLTPDIIHDCTEQRAKVLGHFQETLEILNDYCKSKPDDERLDKFREYVVEELKETEAVADRMWINRDPDRIDFTSNAPLPEEVRKNFTDSYDRFKKETKKLARMNAELMIAASAPKLIPIGPPELVPSIFEGVAPSLCVPVQDGPDITYVDITSPRLAKPELKKELNGIVPAIAASISTNEPEQDGNEKPKNKMPQVERYARVESTRRRKDDIGLGF